MTELSEPASDTADGATAIAGRLRGLPPPIPDAGGRPSCPAGRRGSWTTSRCGPTAPPSAGRPARSCLAVYDLDGDRTAIDLATKDAPYLVDSVRAELERTGHLIEHLLHPQIVVRRDAEGRIVQLLDLADTAEVPSGATAESWMHIETNLIPAAEHPVVAADLRRVLTDVHNAVSDAPETYRLIRELADRIDADPGEFDRETSAEAAELLRWLADGNFMILGHAAYSANELTNPTRSSAAVEQGVLRGEAKISPLELLPAYRSGAPLVIFKSPMVSTVRRSTRYDCVTVIAPGSSDAEARIHVFLGLITDESDGTVARVPVVRRRIEEILSRSGARAESHTGRQLLAALRTLPRDELLEAPTPDLLRLAQLVVDRAERRGIGVFARIHLNRDFVTVLVYFPSERFGPETRARVRDVVLSHWPGRIIGRDDRLVELYMARMQFLIALRPGEEVPNPDRATVETEVARVTRRWSDDLADLLTVGLGEQEADRVLRRYTGAFPEAYKEDFGAPTAVADLRRLEQLPDHDGLSFDVYTPAADDEADRRLKIYRTGTPLSLGRTLPMLERMGIEVLDERPYEIERTDGTSAWVYDFGLKLGEGVDFSQERSVAVLDTLRVLWAGGVEQDGFNALVVRAGLTWQQASVLRAYSKYLRQAGTTFSQGYIEQTLSQHTGIARLLIELFESRFDPAIAEHESEKAQADIRAAIDDELAQVSSLDQDRILRSLLGLISASLRTNYYQQDEAARRAGRVRGQAGSAFDRGPARAAAAVRDLGVLTAGGGRAPAIRPGGPRRPALVGPPGGLPHRGARPGQGPDGEEHRDRAGGLQGRLRGQVAAGPVGGPGRLAGRGGGLLPDLRHLAAGADRQLLPGRCRPASRRRAVHSQAAGHPVLRRRRPVPGGGRRQGHRDVLRHRQPDRGGSGLLAG